MRGERCNAARENEGSNDGATVPPLRTHFTSVCTRTAEAHDGERKGVAEGFIVPAHEVRRCDLELLLWKSVVVGDNEDDSDDDDEDEDEVGLDDRLDPVETIRYFPMASASLSFFDTSRFAHSRRLFRNKVSRHLRKIVSADIADSAILNNL